MGEASSIPRVIAKGIARDMAHRGRHTGMTIIAMATIMAIKAMGTKRRPLPMRRKHHRGLVCFCRFDLNGNAGDQSSASLAHQRSSQLPERDQPLLYRR
jgi:hypothetical protein